MGWGAIHLLAFICRLCRSEFKEELPILGGAIAGSMSLGVTTMPLPLKADAGQMLMPYGQALQPVCWWFATHYDGDCRGLLRTRYCQIIRHHVEAFLTHY